MVELTMEKEWDTLKHSSSGVQREHCWHIRWIRTIANVCVARALVEDWAVVNHWNQRLPEPYILMFAAGVQHNGYGP